MNTSSIVIDLDEEDDFISVVVKVVYTRRRKRRRLCDGKGRVFRPRLQWNVHIELLLLEGEFDRTFRMRPSSLEKLLQKIAPSLSKQTSVHGTFGVEFLKPETSVMMSLRWLAGGSYSDIRLVAGCSVATFYRHIWEVMHALIKNMSYLLRWPATRFDFQQLVEGFASKSNREAMKGCVFAVDGWLCMIKVPSEAEVGCVKEYYSGHYKCYGLNVQVACDVHSRVIWVSVICPGGTNDWNAFKESSLPELIENLPDSLFGVGDNAYVGSDKLLSPFTKAQLSNKYQDSFNFHLSQCRIRIEMTLAYLVTKWRIFKKPLECDFVKHKVVIFACMILHNFCVNERLLRDPQFKITSADIEPVPLPNPVRGGHTEEEMGYLPSDQICRITPLRNIPGVSLKRSMIVHNLELNNILRPSYNVARKEKKNT